MQSVVKSLMYATQGWPPAKAANGASSYVGLQVEAMRQLGVDGYVYTRVLDGPREPNVYSFADYAAKRGLSDKVMDTLLGRMGRGLWLKWREPVPLLRAVEHAVKEHGVQALEIEEAWGVAGSVAARCAAPVVVRMHGPWFLVGTALGLDREKDYDMRVKVEGEALSKAHGITAPSRFVLEKTREHYGLELPGAKVIANPVKKVDAAMKWTLEGSQRRDILFVGRFDRCKGGDLLLHAFNELGKRDKHVNLLWAGPDPGLTDDQGKRWSLSDYVRHAIPDASVRDRVKLLGQQLPGQITDLRKRTRMAIVCSRYETFPMVALEAMAAGSPLVTGTAGGIREIVEHEKTAVTCDPADPRNFADAMQRVLEDDALAVKIGAAATVEVEQRYDLLALARETLGYYAGVIGSR